MRETVKEREKRGEREDSPPGETPWKDTKLEELYNLGRVPKLTLGSPEGTQRFLHAGHVSDQSQCVQEEPGRPEERGGRGGGERRERSRRETRRRERRERRRRRREEGQEEEGEQRRREEEN